MTGTLSKRSMSRSLQKNIQYINSVFSLILHSRGHRIIMAILGVVGVQALEGEAIMWLTCIFTLLQEYGYYREVHINVTRSSRLK